MSSTGRALAKFKYSVDVAVESLVPVYLGGRLIGNGGDMHYQCLDSYTFDGIAGYAIITGLSQAMEAYYTYRQRKNELAALQLLTGVTTAVAGLLYATIGTSLLALCLPLAANSLVRAVKAMPPLNVPDVEGGKRVASAVLDMIETTAFAVLGLGGNNYVCAGYWVSSFFLKGVISSVNAIPSLLPDLPEPKKVIYKEFGKRS